MDAELGTWLQALQIAGLRCPDATQVPVSQGAAIAAGQYKVARALVFLKPLTDDIHTALVDKGWQVLDFSNPDHWSAQFNLYPDVFGNNNT